jgi:Ion channel.
VNYFLRFIPLIRGGYALSLVVSWLSHNTISTLFMTYLTILLSTVYFSSLLFFNVEKPVNPQVTNYGDSLWWAFMDVTTVGSNISAKTAIGKILSIVLASMGMMMFPIFTVYITNRITEANKKKPTILDLHLKKKTANTEPDSESNK